MASAVAAGCVGDSDKPPSSFVGFGWFGRVVHAAGSGRPGRFKIFSSLLDGVDEAGQGALFEIRDNSADLAEAIKDVRVWQDEGMRLLTVLDPDYPLNLRLVHQQPPFLFARGKVADDELSVAVVGTRRPSERGVRHATEIARGLAERGVTVASGLAQGIDTAAHKAALAVGGRTVAVIGTGLRRFYPAQNTLLQQKISHDGLVLSQFWPDAPPTKHSFPMRNAVMSGYCLATVVIEALEKSGARMQAHLALEHGRHVFLMRSLLEHEWARNYASRPNTTVVDDAQQVFDGLDRLRPVVTDELTWA
jgi:DNA processing protein